MKDSSKAVTDACTPIQDTSTHTKVSGAESLSSDSVQEVLLALVTMSDIAGRHECAQDDFCESHCPCYIGDLTTACLEVLLDGPTKESARSYIRQKFEEHHGETKTLH